ncbi:zonadhesin-like [Hyperolius riggenbachi]|uniref:zonadhesin-like n=1 Tax=Hyperolius riggenbachi TaxID=752182 RepID=UPI0035A27738
MPWTFGNFMLLQAILIQCFIFVIQETSAFERCPEDYKHTDCLTCSSFCPNTPCPTSCKEGCRCTHAHHSRLDYECVHTKQCTTLKTVPVQCPKGSTYRPECRRDCKDYCPGIHGECLECHLGCKCDNENEVMHNDSCIPVDKCKQV